MPTKYKQIPEELQKIDYGTAKSHYANVRFKQGLPKIAGGDIKKGTPAYNEIVLLQKSLKEKDFILLLAELADRSPEHWQLMAKYFEKRGYDIKIAGQVLAYAKTLFGESKGPLDSISQLAIAGAGGGPIQEAPKPLPPPLVQAPKVNKKYPAGFLNLIPQIDPYINQSISFKQHQAEQKEREKQEKTRQIKNKQLRLIGRFLKQEIKAEFDGQFKPLILYYSMLFRKDIEKNRKTIDAIEIVDGVYGPFPDPPERFDVYNKQTTERFIRDLTEFDTGYTREDFIDSMTTLAFLNKNPSDSGDAS